VVAPGTVIGPWRLVRELGSGGMGRVYLAERADGEFLQTAALKLLRPAAGSEEILRRFEQERQILASLDHPSIARLVDGGRTPDGRPYFVMEHVEGLPIDRYCDEERLSVEARLELFCQVARAVQHAHRNLVVHRDLKPSNIVVTVDGEVKLLDFGIAKLLSPVGRPSEPPTRTLARLLTPEYASPEQVLGLPITTASDVYQLGLLLYELLCGVHPQELAGGASGSLEAAVCRRVPQRPSTVRDVGPFAAASDRRGVSPAGLRRRLRGDLDTIVMTALRKEPEARYPSVEQMVADIGQHLGGRPISVRHRDRPYRLRKFLERNWGRTLSAAALALLVLGYAVTAGVQSREIARQRDLARSEADRAMRVQGFLSQVIAATGDPVALDLAAERLGELDARPDVKATMLRTLGEMNVGFGRVEVALPLLEEAVALAAAVHGEPSDESLRSRTSLARAQHLAGRLGEAAAAYERLAILQRRRGASGHGELADVLRSAGSLAALRGEYRRADRALREAMAIQRRLETGRIPRPGALPDGPEAPLPVIFPGTQPHLRLARTLRDLADLDVRRGAFGEAERLALEALALEGLEPGYPPSRCESLHLLGRLRWAQGRPREAERLLAQALRVSRSYGGREKAFVTAIRLHRVRLLAELGRPEEARDLLATAVRALGEELPRDRLLRVEMLRARALLDRAAGDGEGALAGLAEAAGILESWGLEEAPDLAELRLDRGLLLVELGHRDRALPLLEAATAVLERELAPGHPLRARARRSLDAARGRPA
jgi:serine/threonine-protein kinase